MIRSVISVTTFTFEASSRPCLTDPKPVVPGVPTVAVPEAVVSSSRLSPIACRPASLAKVASSICPTCWVATWPESVTETWPLSLMVTEVASIGIVMPG